MPQVDGLYPFEIVMLFLGILFFVILALLLIYQLKHGKPAAGLAAFFLLSIVMIGFPSIKSVQIGDIGARIARANEDLQADPANPQIKENLKKQVNQISDRPFSNLKTLINIHDAQIATGQPEKANKTAERIRQINPSVLNRFNGNRLIIPKTPH